MAKVAFLSFYSGIVDRGVETFVYELSRRFKLGNKITIFQAGPAIYQEGIRVQQIAAKAEAPKSSKGILGKLYLDLQSIRILIFTLKLIPQIIKEKFDIVVPLNGGWQTAAIRLLTKITGSKMLISGHAGVGSDDAWNIFWRPDVFIALTSAQKKWAEEIAPEMKTEIIPNGVDLAKFNPKVKPKNINLEKPIVVCVSALVPYKRIELTIKAVAKAKNLSLLILGDGEMNSYLDSLGRRILKSRYLRLTPPYQQMPSYYKCGTVFTLASKTEAFGISYLEAMACNLPVVTTCDDSRQEIIGKAGILTDPTKTEQYAKDLLIASKTNYRNIPYDQALKFSWNKVANKYLKLIEEITRKK